MYLPPEINKAQVLITVKTYPLPSGKYGELVCTAGLLNGEKWIRIYPVAYTFLQDNNQYPKYGWVELDLVRNTSDFRVESYRPRLGLDEEIKMISKIGTDNNWSTRKSYVLKEVFESMNTLINLAKSNQKKSLAVVKPLEIIDFVIENTERQWKETWLAQSKQGNFFELDIQGQSKERRLVRKLPYKYSYRFRMKDDNKPRQMMIEDWEIGALFWNCLKNMNGDEEKANQLVRKKYFDDFVSKTDLYFFVGTTKQFHNVSPNPFVIIGLFYPPKTSQLSLF